MQSHHAVYKDILNVSAPPISRNPDYIHTVKTPTETTQITNFFDERTSSFHGLAMSFPQLSILHLYRGGLYLRFLYLPRTQEAQVHDKNKVIDAVSAGSIYVCYFGVLVQLS